LTEHLNFTNEEHCLVSKIKPVNMTIDILRTIQKDIKLSLKIILRRKQQTQKAFATKCKGFKYCKLDFI